MDCSASRGTIEGLHRKDDISPDRTLAAKYRKFSWREISRTLFDIIQGDLGLHEPAQLERVTKTRDGREGSGELRFSISRAWSKRVWNSLGGDGEKRWLNAASRILQARGAKSYARRTFRSLWGSLFVYLDRHFRRNDIALAFYYFEERRPTRCATDELMTLRRSFIIEASYFHSRFTCISKFLLLCYY